MPSSSSFCPERTSSTFNSLMKWDKDSSYLVYKAYKSNHSQIPLLILEFSAHGVPWIILPILFFIFKHDLSPQASSLVFNFLGITALDFAVVGVLKPLCHRSRPVYNTGLCCITIPSVDQFSFPSGHATRVYFVAFFLSYVRALYPEALHPVLASSPFIAAVYVWALLVCFSRVALGRHHILDVAAGAVLGMLYVVVWTPFWFSTSIADRFRQFLSDYFLGWGSAKMVEVGSSTSSSIFKYGSNQLKFISTVLRVTKDET